MGPGTTVIDGYRGALRFNNEQAQQQQQRAATGLALVEKIRQAQMQAAKDRALRESGDDLGALEGALLRAGDVAGAEKVGKMRRDKAYEAEVAGAVGPDGALDWGKVASAGVRYGQPGALNAGFRADQEAEKRRRENEDRGALRYLLGDPAPDGPPGELPATGEMPQEGMRPNPPPGRPGALDAYLKSPNPAIARQAGMLRDMIQAKAISPRDAVRQLGALAQGDVRVGIVDTQEQGKTERAERRMDEMVRWDSKRGVGFTRGGEVILPKDLPGLPATGPNGANAEPKALQTMRWKVKTLVEAGVPMEDAQRIVAGGASMQVNPNTRARMAQGLMKLTKEDMVTPVYRSLGEALQAVDEALGANSARQGALPPAPDALPGSLSDGARGAPPAAPRPAPAIGASGIDPSTRYKPAPRDPAQRVKGEIYVSPRTGGYVKWTGEGWEAVD